MKALISGKVLQVTAEVSKNGKAYNAVSVLQQFPSSDPFVLKARCWNGKVPKVGDPWEALADIKAFSFKDGHAGLSCDVY